MGPLSSLGGKDSCPCLVSLPAPHSWWFCALLWSGILVAYTLRVNMSVAAQQMRDELGWSETEKGLILSSFYWGYALGQLPASHFAMLHGAKMMMGLSVLAPSLLSILFPAAAKTSFVLALFVRMLIGLTEACCFPAVFHFFPHWIPTQDKTIMVPATLSGVYLGEMVAFLVSGLIIDKSLVSPQGYELAGWRGAFYSFGLVGCLWFPFWMYFAYEKPQDHPDLSAEELAYIRDGSHPIPAAASESESPLRAASRSVSVSVPSFSHTGIHGERAPSGVYGERLLLFPSPPPPTSSSSPRFPSDPSSGIQDLPGGAGSTRRNDSNDDLDRPLLGGFFNSVQPHSSLDSSTHSHASLSLAAAVLAPVGISGGGAQWTTGDPSHHPQSQSSWSDLVLLYRRTPWGLILSSPAVLTLFFASFTNGYIGFLLLSEMPSYLTDQLGFDLGAAGILCVAPYTALFITSLLWGSVFYSMQIHYGWTTRTVRQVAQFIAFGASSLVLMVAAFVRDRWLAYACLILAQGMLGACQSGLSCCYLDLCPNFSPLLNTIGNTLSALAGILGPLVVSAILDATKSKSDDLGWQLVFSTCAVLSTVSLLLWFVYQTSTVDEAMNRGRQWPPTVVSVTKRREV